MGLIPTTKKHVLTLVSELLRQGEFTVHELFDKLYSRGQQIGLADLQELLDEKKRSRSAMDQSSDTASKRAER
jgi:hypothetical protein